MIATLPAKPKLIIFGSPNLLVRRPHETIWETVFSAAGEEGSYRSLLRRFKAGKFTPYRWAEASEERLAKAGLTKAAYYQAITTQGLAPGAAEFVNLVGLSAIVSGGFSDLCLKAAEMTGVRQMVAQATQIFDEIGKLAAFAILNCDYQGKVHFASAVAGSMGFGLEECILIAEGEGDIPLAQAMPSVAFNAPPIVERACNASVRARDLTELLNLFRLEEKEKATQGNERRIPNTVLIGNQQSDAVIVDFDGQPNRYEAMLDMVAAIGPLITDKPGAGDLIRNIDGTGIRTIYVTGKPSVFRPDAALDELVKTRPQLKINRLEEGIKPGSRQGGIRFAHAAVEGRKVYQSPFVPDNFSFLVCQFAGQAVVDIYRDRQKIETLTGTRFALLESIVAKYGARISGSNAAWLGRQLFGKEEVKEDVMEFETVRDAYVPVIKSVWANGRKYMDERGEEAIEMSPLAVRIRDASDKHLLDKFQLSQEQAMKFIRQFTGEESAKGFDYDVWTRIRGQAEDVVMMLKMHPETRRAHLLIARDDDVRNSMAGIEQPCHFALDFTVREGKLDVCALMRSNDVVRAFPADAFAAMRLQQRMAGQLGLGIGTYTHLSTRAQIYSRDYGLVQDILKN